MSKPQTFSIPIKSYRITLYSTLPIYNILHVQNDYTHTIRLCITYIHIIQYSIRLQIRFEISISVQRSVCAYLSVVFIYLCNNKIGRIRSLIRISYFDIFFFLFFFFLYFYRLPKMKLDKLQHIARYGHSFSSLRRENKC